MERTERIALLHGLLTRNRYGLSNDRLMREAECSRSTLYRDLSFMRDTLGAPLEHEGDPARIWRYVNRDASAFQLPGVWLSADELYALMLAQQVLQRSGAGLLGQALGPLQPRIHKILGDKARRLDRLRVLRTQARNGNQTVFRIVTESVLEGRQLRFTYQARSTQQERQRLVSPQRLIHHKDNWYLDAWDPDQSALRRFALDRIHKPELSTEAAIDIPSAQLDTHQEAGYGIFAGPVTATAVIHFTPHAARWIADEHWHPAQRQRLLPDGALELTLPLCQPPRTADGRATLRRRRRSHRANRTARADARDADGGVGKVCSGVGHPCLSVGADLLRDALASRGSGFTPRCSGFPWERIYSAMLWLPVGAVSPRDSFAFATPRASRPTCERPPPIGHRPQAVHNVALVLD